MRGAFLDMFSGNDYSLKLGVADYSVSGNPGKTSSGNNSDGKMILGGIGFLAFLT